MSDIRYISTRQGSRTPVERLTFEEVVLAGLARDGGLFVPDRWPSFSPAEIAALRGLSYAELAARIMAPFVGETFDAATFARLVREAYAGFDDRDVAPLKALPVDDLHLLELFHGPTLAFKDVALQFLGRVLDALLTRSGKRARIIGATSGDTGSAAIEAVRDRAAIDIFMLHPKGRVSEVQRRQMTTVLARNVHNVAIEGTFDDCQDLAKACFNDLAFRDRHRLTAVNSINFARVMAQIVYYFHAALKLGAPDRKVSFCVPTGNFGNIYAGYAARQMGLPIASCSTCSTATAGRWPPPWSASAAPARCRSRPRSWRAPSRRSTPAASTMPAPCAPSPRRGAKAARSSTRTPPWPTPWRARSAATAPCRWSCWRRRIPPSSPTRWAARSARRRRCRRGWRRWRRCRSAAKRSRMTSARSSA
jgi:hypothetical protein